MSSVLSNFCNSFFTFIFTAAVVVLWEGSCVGVLLFVPVILYSSRKIGRQCEHDAGGRQAG